MTESVFDAGRAGVADRRIQGGPWGELVHLISADRFREDFNCEIEVLIAGLAFQFVTPDQKPPLDHQLELPEVFRRRRGDFFPRSAKFFGMPGSKNLPGHAPPKRLRRASQTLNNCAYLSRSLSPPPTN